MTLDELMALPDITGGFRPEPHPTLPNTVIPVWHGYSGLLWHESDDPLCIEDADGNKWEVGRLKGQWVRRCVHRALTMAEQAHRRRLDEIDQER